MTDTHYHIGNVIREASQNNPYFRTSLLDKLKQLQGRFDLKYWPRLDDVMKVIAEDARMAVPIAIDSITEVATRGERASLVDYFRALFEAIECNRQKEYGFLPNDFKLTDNTIATLANCALALEPKEMIDGLYVKNFRSRERKRIGSDSNFKYVDKSGFVHIHKTIYRLPIPITESIFTVIYYLRSLEVSQTVILLERP